MVGEHEGGRRGGRKEGESLSHSHTASHTLSLNAISPGCQAEMRGGADKKTACVCVLVCVPVPVLDPRTRDTGTNLIMPT